MIAFYDDDDDDDDNDVPTVEESLPSLPRDKYLLIGFLSLWLWLWLFVMVSGVV